MLPKRLLAVGSFRSEKLRPVEYTVIDVDLRLNGSLLEKALQENEIGLLFELHAGHVVHIEFELTRTASAQLIDRDFLLELAHVGVVRRPLADPHLRPRQTASEQVDHHVAQRDQVVAARQLVAIVPVN